MLLVVREFLTLEHLGSDFFPWNQSYPAVPYSSLGMHLLKEHSITWALFCSLDFTDHMCTSSSGGIENYDDIYQVRLARRKVYSSELGFV